MMAFVSKLDHLVIGAPLLADGMAHVQDVLGVTMEPGGAHPRMGTHNALLRLGDGIYLEVIAPDPAAPAPTRPRWFDLDRLTPPSPPTLLTWVIRTDGIDEMAQAASDAGVALGPIEAMSRGTRHWKITIPDDGRIPMSGVGPSMIQWQAEDVHPAQSLSDQGVTLERMELVHPQPQPLLEMVRRISLHEPRLVIRQANTGEPAHWSVVLQTPKGQRVLSTLSASAVP